MKIASSTLVVGLAYIVGTTKALGRVKNNSGISGKWARYGTGGSTCDVYNWNGGAGRTGWSEKRNVQCQKHDFDGSDDVGGSFIDVDGITFPNDRWRIIWESGERHDLAANVWVKFSDFEILTCTRNVQVPECRVKCSSIGGIGCVGE